MTELSLETQNIVPHPWRRYFARTLDLGIYSGLLTIFQLFVLRWNTDATGLVSIIETIFAGFLMVLIEPLLLAKLGTTPGKWIFGLVLRDEQNEKITYLDGLWRTFTVFKLGLGFSIPFYNIYRSIKSYSQCDQKMTMEWDEEFTYYIKDLSGLRILGYIATSIGVFVLAILIFMQAELPIHRGNISTQEYYENCNDFMKYNHMDLGQIMDENGKWVTKTSNGSTITYFSLRQPIDHEITYENGMIQKVVLEVESTSDMPISSYGDQLFMAYHSLVGSQKSVNVWQLQDKEIVNRFVNSFEDFDFIKGDIKVTNRVEYSGYRDGRSYLFPEENQDQRFHLVFTLERQ